MTATTLPASPPEHVESVEQALRFYADGKHFDVADGCTRIIDSGAVASGALKILSAEYDASKGNATALPDEPAFVTLSRGVDSPAGRVVEYVDALLQSFNAERLRADTEIKQLRKHIDRGRDSTPAELKLSAQLEEQRNGNIKLLERAEALAKAEKRAYQFLETYGVSTERAKSVANGIQVLMTRIDRERNAYESEIARLKSELAIAEAKNRSSLANNLCPDHRDKQQGKPCLACTVEQLQTKILKKDMDR